MLLKVGERIGLLNILPESGNLETMRIVHELRMRVGLTEQEIEQVGLKNKLMTDPETGAQSLNLHWDDENYEAEIEIGPRAHVMILDALKGFDEAGSVTEQMLPLYDKFAETK